MSCACSSQALHVLGQVPICVAVAGKWRRALAPTSTHVLVWALSFMSSSRVATLGFVVVSSGAVVCVPELRDPGRRPVLVDGARSGLPTFPAIIATSCLHSDFMC